VVRVTKDDLFDIIADAEETLVRGYRSGAQAERMPTRDGLFDHIGEFMGDSSVQRDRALRRNLDQHSQHDLGRYFGMLQAVLDELGRHGRDKVAIKKHLDQAYRSRVEQGTGAEEDRLIGFAGYVSEYLRSQVQLMR
jgi:hypothetical protein